jgi:hypothetical protein
MVSKEDNPDLFDLVADQPKGDKLIPVRLWRGLVTENVVQAIACDILTNSMLRLHRDGVSIAAAIHDEIVAVAPAARAEATLQRMLEVMRSPPAWASGLPLAAEGYIAHRFIKPKNKETTDAGQRSGVAATKSDGPAGGGSGVALRPRGDGPEESVVRESADHAPVHRSGDRGAATVRARSSSSPSSISLPVTGQIMIEGDCLAALRQMPASSVAVVVTSPPYNLGKKYGVYDDNLPKAEYLAGQERSPKSSCGCCGRTAMCLSTSDRTARTRCDRSRSV